MGVIKVKKVPITTLSISNANGINKNKMRRLRDGRALQVVLTWEERKRKIKEEAEEEKEGESLKCVMINRARVQDVAQQVAVFGYDDLNGYTR